MTQRPIIIAHRGASGQAPENTLAAFALALELGADAIEIDLHQTRDGRLVVLHDFSLRRTTGDHRRVRSVTFAELRRLSAGGWWSARFRAERVPALEEVLDLARGRAFLHLELKRGSPYYPGIETALVDAVDRADAWNGVRVSSFDATALATLQAQSQRLELGLLTDRTRTATILRLAQRLRVRSVHLALRRCGPAAHEALNAAGFPVYVYTVNEPDQLRAVVARGLQGIFTNFPDRLARILDRGARTATGPKDLAVRNRRML